MDHLKPNAANERGDDGRNADKGKRVIAVAEDGVYRRRSLQIVQHLHAAYVAGVDDAVDAIERVEDPGGQGSVRNRNYSNQQQNLPTICFRREVMLAPAAQGGDGRFAIIDGKVRRRRLRTEEVAGLEVSMQTIAQDVISVECMRDSDAATIEAGTSSLELMGRAAHGIRLAMAAELSGDGPDPAGDVVGRYVVFVGGGNNGGDGYALAGILAGEGSDVIVRTVSEKVSADGAFYRDKALGAGVDIGPLDPSGNDLDGASVIVDCIFGTGFHGMPRGIAAHAIEAINASGAKVVCADINSGMNGDSGSADLAVRSDLTVSIGQLKNGMMLASPGLIGKLVNVHIGIEPVRPQNRMLDEAGFDALMEELGGSDVREIPADTLAGAPETEAAGPVEEAIRLAEESDSPAIVRFGSTDLLVHRLDGRWLATFRRPAWASLEPIEVPAR